MRISTLAGEKSFDALAERLYGKQPKAKHAVAVRALREANPVLATARKFPAAATIAVPAVPAIGVPGDPAAGPTAPGNDFGSQAVGDGLQALRQRLRAGAAQENARIKEMEHLLTLPDVQAFIKELSPKQQRIVTRAPAARKKETKALASLLRSERFKVPAKP